MTRRTDADATGRVEPIGVRWRPSDMTIRGALAAGVLLGLTACGEQGAATPPTATSAATEPAAGAGLVLRVEYTGGFVSPSATAARLPLVSIYADGRVISEGPTPAIYPGPALPNLQERHIDPGQVKDLVGRALAAGVADTSDLGMPPIADATSTRITLVTAETTYVREAYALTEGTTETTGLTEAQQAARGKLGDLLDTLTGPTADSGDTAAYSPAAIAALATPWVDAQEGP